MKLIISPYMYYGFLVFFFVYDIFMYLKFGRKNPKFKMKIARWGCVLSFLIVGLVVTINGILPASVALPPAILAALLSYYVMFVKYLPEQA